MQLFGKRFCSHWNWFCHNSIKSLCSTASQYCAHVKAWRCFLSNTQEREWFTQESSYRVISGQYGTACISCVIRITGKPAVNHPPCQRSKKAFEHFEFWTWKSKLFCKVKNHHGICMCLKIHTYGDVWFCIWLPACVYRWVCVLICKRNVWQWKCDDLQFYGHKINW